MLIVPLNPLLMCLPSSPFATIREQARTGWAPKHRPAWMKRSKQRQAAGFD